jgi:hypothetical protein
MARIAYPVTDAGATRDLAAQVLASIGFSVGWYDAWNGHAELTRALNFAPARLSVQLTSGPDGPWLHLTQTTSGAWGGVIGYGLVSSEFQTVIQHTSGYLGSHGLLRGHPQMG